MSRTRAAPRTSSSGTPLVFTLLGSCLLVLLAACGGPPEPRPDDGDNGVFTITTPAAGSQVSGAVYFGIQLQDAAKVSRVRLYVGDELVTPAFPGENALRVFLIPRDHPEGALELRAVVRSQGTDFERAISVQVVHAPPSSATVSASGAVLGDSEASGAISTISIPRGLITGASISFETMTQAEVLAATGVDYDTLGVTFLGAQQIDSTRPTGDGLAITSGGFGPMVQPGQTVVNYRIGPDMGRGVGELMVTGSAAVAPNGDVVTTPPVVAQSGEATASSLLGTTALRAHRAGTSLQQSALPAGPPGTLIEIKASGLNIYAVNGYYLRFRVGSMTAEAAATVGLNSDGRQYLLAVVPPLPSGAATVELVWKVGDTVFGTYAMNITGSQAITGSAKALVDANYLALLNDLDASESSFQSQGIDLDFGPMRTLIATARADYASRAESDSELQALARSLWNGGVRPTSTQAEVRPMQTSAACMLNAFKYINDKKLAERAFRGDRYETGFRALQADLSLGYLNRFADRLYGFDEYDCDPYKEYLCQELGNCGPDEIVTDPWGDEYPNSPWPPPSRQPQNTGPSSWVTGMGSAPWPGSPVGGNFFDDGYSPIRASGLLSQQSVEAGRYAVTGMYNGAPLPFGSLVQEDGYFFLPMMPEGAGGQLVFSDLQDFRSCVLPITGRAMGSALALNVDFASCAGGPVDPGEYTIRWTGDWSTQWNQAQNWDPQRVPNASDDVWIPGAASYVQMPAGGLYQPPVEVQVRSLRSQGVLAMSNTILRATGDVQLGAFRPEGTGPATVDAGGSFTYESLHVWMSSPGYHLPNAPVELKSVVVAGMLVVPHSLTFTQDLTLLNSGQIAGPGTTTVPAGLTAAIGSGTTNAGSFGPGHTLVVHGTFRVVHGLPAPNGSSFQFHNVHIAPGGLMEVSGNTALTSSVPGGSGHLHVEGRLLVSGANSDVFAMSALIENDGVIEVENSGSMLRFSSSDLGGLRLGSGGALRGQGSTVIDFATLAEFFGGTIGAGHTFINRAGQFRGAVWVAGAGPLTLEAGAEIRNIVNPENGMVSTFTVNNNQPLLGSGTFRNSAVLRKAATGNSTWSVCYVEEGSGTYVPDPGTITFAGGC